MYKMSLSWYEKHNVIYQPLVYLLTTCALVLLAEVSAGDDGGEPTTNKNPIIFILYCTTMQMSYIMLYLLTTSALGLLAESVIGVGDNSGEPTTNKDPIKIVLYCTTMQMSYIMFYLLATCGLVLLGDNSGKLQQIRI